MSKRGFEAKSRKLLMDGRDVVPCHWCEDELTIKTATVDHVHPLGDGGPDTIDNKVLCCQPCNNIRGLAQTILKGQTRRGKRDTIVLVQQFAETVGKRDPWLQQKDRRKKLLQWVNKRLRGRR